jgi:hypothetical protein
MRVISAHPPNITAILKAFPEACSAGVMFCYDDTIYAHGYNEVSLPDEYHVHESVHMEQQREYCGGSEDWWKEYITDPEFRLAQEVPAYRAQYRFLIKGAGRRVRRKVLPQIAKMLSSALYGRMLSFNEAKHLLEKGL